MGIVAAFWLLRRVGLTRLLPALTPRRVTLGALLGAWSHVLLDSVMHADIQPLQPLSAANGLLGLVPLSALHWGCLACGVVAMAIAGIRYLLKRSGSTKP